MGKIVEMADGEELFRRSLNPYTHLLLAAIPKLNLQKRSDPTAVREESRPLSSEQGCSFQPRCPHSKERCKVEEPQLLDAGGGHRVACHFPL